MKKKPSNPPAFPLRVEGFTQRGMTLRDWFAGQAMASCEGVPYDDRQHAARAAKLYGMADAMLAEREKEGEG